MATNAAKQPMTRTLSEDEEESNFDFIRMMEEAKANLNMAAELWKEAGLYSQKAIRILEGETITPNKHARTETTTVNKTMSVPNIWMPTEIVVVRELIPDASNLHQVVYWFDRKLLSCISNKFEFEDVFLTKEDKKVRRDILKNKEQALRDAGTLNSNEWIAETKKEFPKIQPRPIQKVITLMAALEMVGKNKITLSLPDVRDLPDKLMKHPNLQDHAKAIRRLRDEYAQARQENHAHYANWTEALISVYNSKTFPVISDEILKQVKFVGEYNVQEMDEMF